MVAAAAAAVMLAVGGAAWIGVHRHDSAPNRVVGGFRYPAPTVPPELRTRLGQVIPMAYRHRAGGFSVPALAVSSSGRAPNRVPFRLGNSAGRVVVISYWASWCPPCRADLPVLNRLIAGTRQQSVDVAAIATVDTRAAAAASAGSAHLPGLPFYFDSSGRTAQQLAGIPVDPLPVTVIVDRQGRIAPSTAEQSPSRPCAARSTPSPPNAEQLSAPP